MADRMVRIVIAADVAAALRGLRDVEGGLGRVGNAGREAERQSSTFGATLSRGLAAAGVVGGIGLVVGGLQKVVSTGLDYEKSMHTFQAVTGASVDVMKQMGDTAKAIGNDVKIPGASAQTTAAAMTELAKGGLTAQQSMEAARGTMILAAAAQIEGGKAAEIQANALNTFGLKADQAGRVANVLANVANKSSGEISDFAIGLSQAGTVANSFGWSIEDTTAMLGLMANAGIKGSDAGTSLKTTMTAMLNPTDSQTTAMEQLGLKIHDANGHMITAQQFTAQLTAAKGRMSDADFTAAAATAFGTDAVRTALVASQAGTKGLDDMTTALTNSTGAQDVAAANSQGLTGALDRLSTVASTAALSLYEKLAPALTGIVDVGATLVGWIGDAVTWFGNLPGPVGLTALALGGVILLKGPLNAMFLSIKTNAIGAATSMRAAFEGQALSFNLQMTSMRLAAAAAGTSFSVLGAGARIAGLSLKAAFLSNPIGIALVGITTALSFFVGGTDDAAQSTEDLGAAIDKTTGKLTESAAAMFTDKAVKSGAADAYKALGGNVADLVDKLGGVPGAAERVDAVLKSAGSSATNAASATGSYGAASTATADILKNSATVTGFLSDSTGKLGQATKNAALTSEGMTGALGSQSSATDTVADSAASATTQSSLFADSVKAMKDAATEADTATQFLNLSLLRLAGSNIDAETASRANEAAMRAIAGAARDLAEAQANVADKTKDQTDAINEFGASSPEAAAAARDLANANDQVADASDKLADSTDKAGQSARDMAADAYNLQVTNGNLAGAVNAAVGVMETQRAKFIESQVAAGVAREEAEKLADAQGLIPANVRTTYEQVGVEQALTDIEKVRASIAAIPDSKIVSVQVDRGDLVYTTSSGAQLRAGGGWVHGAGGPKDDKVPLNASPGEFIVNAAQSKKNAGLLEAINAGTMGFADGGVVPAAGDTGASAAVSVAGAVALPDVGAFQAAWAAIAAAVQQAWAGIIQPALDALTVKSADVGVQSLALRTGSVEPAWAGITAAVTGSVNNNVLPTYAALNEGTLGVGQGMLDLLNGAVIPVWTQTGAAVSNTWVGTIAPTYGQINAGTASVGQAQWDLLNNAVIPAWSGIGSQINTTYSTQIVPAWDGVKGFANETGAFFTGINTGVSESRTQITEDLTKITAAIDEFFKMVDGKAPAVTATVTAGAAVPFADGGMVTGPGGPRDDKVHIAASSGEYVVNAKATAAHRTELDAMNFGGGFADGGVVGEKIKTPVKDRIVAGAQRAVTAGVDRVVSAMAAFTSGLGSGLTGPVPAGARGAFMKAVASQMGLPYVWGGASPPNFDCSGLMSWGLTQAGVGKGRLTAAEFGDNFPRVNPEKPGDMAIFDTGRVSPKAGHIGMVLDPTAGTMMHTDGAGPSRTSPYRGRSGLMGFIDAIGGSYSPTPSTASKQGDPPAAGWLQATLDRIKTGVTNGVTVGQGGTGAAALNTVDPIQDFGPTNMARGTMAMVGPVPSGGAEPRWGPMVEGILALKGKPLGGNKDRAMYQMHTESSGNPLAYNDTDRNYTGGHPSKGLWQTIPSTFRRWADQGFNTNIWHPESNFRAASNYVDANYGGIFPGRAYDQGGDLMPGWTAAFNGTGKREKILTDPQYTGLMGAALTPQFAPPVVNVASPQIVINLDNTDQLQVAVAGMIRAGVDDGLGAVKSALFTKDAQRV